MVAYFGAVWGCRYFWLSLVKMDLRARYRGSVLGLGWSLLQPIAMTAIICTVFSKIFNVEVSTFAPFLMSGLTFWNFIVTASIQGTQSFFQGECYIRQYPAPMAIYPLRTLLGAAFHFTLALLLVVALKAVVGGLGSPWPLLSLGPTLLLLMVFGWSLAVLFGLATVRFRDTHHLSEVFFQGLFYLTPVMYPPRMLIERGLGFLVDYNPLVPFLDLLRQPILDGAFPPWRTFGTATLITLSAAGLAALALRREERQLIFHL